MAKKMNRIATLCLFLMLVLIAIAVPVSAVTLTVNLNKTYQTLGANLSTIQTIDLGNPSASQVGILSTSGTNSDIQTIQMPQINSLERIFTLPTASSNGNVLTINGGLDTTIGYSAQPYPIYIQSTIPTIKVTTPGQSGNPFVLEYNASSSSGSTLDSVIDSVDARYLYRNGGILYEDPSGYYSYPGAYGLTNPTGWVYNTSNLPFTLNQNIVNLNPFTSLNTASQTLGSFYPQFDAGTGKYYAGALSYNEGSQTATIDALSRVIFLSESTPIVWTDASGSRTLPVTYVIGQNGNVTLSFGGSTPVTPVNISYMLINSTAQYAMTQSIDTQQFTNSAADQWTSIASNNPVLEIMGKVTHPEANAAYTYNLSVVGQTISPGHIITPGYGFVRKTSSSQITIPAADLSSLNSGTYDLYLRGDDINNNIIAFSQGQVSIQSPTTPPLNPPTITTVSISSGYQNATVNFTVTGTNFPTQFGTSGVTVSLAKILNTSITATVTSVTSTTIQGSFAIPYNAVPGSWDVVVATQNAGEAIKPGAFTINTVPTPVISSVLPTTATLNSTIYFTVTGTNFQTGSGMTLADFTLGAGATKFDNGNNITINSVTATSINGTMVIGLNAPPGNWNLTVTTINGGTSLVKTSALVVTPSTKPTITTVAPTSAILNTTIYFTVTGTNFQTGSGMTVANFTLGAGAAKFDNGNNVTINSVTATSINGTMVIGLNAPPGNWNLTVTTINGGTSLLKTSALTVSPVGKPTITTVVPASAYLNTTIYFTVTGTNFQTGSDMTVANFTYGSFSNANITINSVTPTSINGTMVIGFDATAGSWNATVTTINGGTSLVKTSAMAVSKFPAPTITAITPASGNLNNLVAFTITGTNFQPSGSRTNVTIYEDITPTVIELPTNIISITPTSIVGTVNVTTNAIAGAYTLNVTTIDGGTASKPAAYTVGYLQIPTITSLTPTTGLLNTTINFTVIGTNFEPGNTVVAFTNQTTGAQLTSILYNAISSTQITGNVSIPNNALTGSYRLDITTTDGGVVNKVNAFTVNAFPAPTFTSITPVSGYQNSSVGFTITGTNFETGVGQTTVAFVNKTTGLPLNSTVVVNTVTATGITGTIVVPFNAQTGTWNVSVTTADGGTVWKPSAFTVNAFPAPTITAITPAVGPKNSSVAFTLTGTNFEPAKTVVNIFENTSTSSTVLTTNIFSVTPTTIIGNVSIPSTAPAGLYTLQVVTVDGGTITRLQAFTVNSQPLPVITSLTPTTGYLNSTVTFTLTGNYFQPNGGTTVMLRTPGTTIYGSLTSVNTTTVLGSFAIPYNAVTGTTNPYTLYVITTGGGFNSKASAFTVLVPTPVISTISPTSGYRNTTVAFTLTGSNFQSGATTVTFVNQTGTQMNPMILSLTPTQIIGSVSIPYTASLNLWNVNVTTVNGGQVSKAGAFTVNVLPAPTITSFVPTAAAHSSSVSFTMTGTYFESNGGTIVMVNSTPLSTPLSVTISTVYPTFVTGTITTPATSGTYYVWVTTADNAGKWVKAPVTFTVV